jgi:hypothetical protein
MKLFESLRIALGSLAANQLRTLLATLGIAIGIAAASSASPRTSSRDSTPTP